ncbi:tRNA nucleotidyltransferase (CCA-adding enzyme) [Skermanella aerolata]|uniref:archease n=1 Tax=Skermanella aerolata TaxID=393310 RepID=UPI003D237525
MTAPEPSHGAWQHFPHDADIGVRGLGATREAAFEQAALVVTAVITDPAKVDPSEPVAVACDVPDDELLLAEWINGLVYEMATRRMLFDRFPVHLDGHWLTARAWGEPFVVARRQPAAEVKGTTYMALRFGRAPDDGRVAECVVDV